MYRVFPAPAAVALQHQHQQPQAPNLVSVPSRSNSLQSLNKLSNNNNAAEQQRLILEEGLRSRERVEESLARNRNATQPVEDDDFFDTDLPRTNKP